MRYAYVSFLDKFDPDGGSSACKGAMPAYSSRTTIDSIVGSEKPKN